LRALGVAVACLALATASNAHAQQPNLSRCAVASSHTHGCGLTWIAGPSMHVDDSVRPAKTGRACAWNFLWLMAFGDVRVSTAMKDAGITRVASVGYQTTELVPFYLGVSRYCTVVRGE
jgi:hypothetical protein